MDIASVDTAAVYAEPNTENNSKVTWLAIQKNWDYYYNYSPTAIIIIGGPPQY